MYLIDILPKAQDDYEQSILWYRKKSYRTSENFSVAIEKTLNSIEQHPRQFKNINDHFYEAVVQDYPFTIVFVIIDLKKVVEVVAIYHQKRNPKKKLRRRK